jgi:hypothetical protein
MKKISILLTGTLILSACSKTVKEIHEAPAKENMTEATPLVNSLSDIDAIKKIMTSQAPNIALAELLAKTVSKGQKEEVRKLIASLSPIEVEKIIAQVKKQNDNIRRDALYHGQFYEEMPFIANGLKNELSINSASLETQLKVSVFSYMKNKALDEIITSYDKKARELTKELSEDIAFEIAQNRALADKITKETKEASEEKVLKTIKESKEFISKVDTYFKTSDLNQKEQYSVLIVGAIAGGIYMKVKDEAGFKHILEEGKKIVRDVTEFKKKAEAAVLLVKTIGNHIDSTATNIRDFSEGMRDSANDINQMFKNAKLDVANSGSVDSRRVADFLYTRVIKGKETNVGGTNASILSQASRINESIGRSGEAAKKIGANLDNILKTAEAITTLLKVGPNNDLHKVIKTASKIAGVVSSVGSVMVGYATGGPFGAAMALSSSPMMAGLMGGGGSQDSAMLAEISRKLDVVIANQKEMMKMQVETMNMIKNVALMIDQYHQTQMVALSELRDIGIVSRELQKLRANSGIRSCEQMIGYRLSSELRDFIKNPKYEYNINNVKLINTQFTASITDLASIQNIAKSAAQSNLNDCGEGIAQAFGEETFLENPLRAIFSSDENNQLVSFERDKYLPLLAMMGYFYPRTSMDTLPLHFPSSDMKMLKAKSRFMFGQIDSGVTGNEVYEIDNLISVKALERYLTSLLILYPILELDKSEWTNSYEEIVQTYVASSKERTRSGYFLRNALKITQSAIAQESILAGEPLLASLIPYTKEIYAPGKCTDDTKTEFPFSGDANFVCAIRSNALLMKNFVVYSLEHQNELSLDFLAKYETAYLNGDLASLAKFLSPRLSEANLKLSKNDSGSEIVLQLNGRDEAAVVKDMIVSVKLPTPQALKEGKILYSENMARLLLMQDLIIENLEKVSPVDRLSGQENLVNLLLVAN